MGHIKQTNKKKTLKKCYCDKLKLAKLPGVLRLVLIGEKTVATKGL